MNRARLLRLFIFYFIGLGPFISKAALVFPNIQSEQDKVIPLEVFGLGTSAKFIGYSHPLGGYSGVEISTSLETLNSSSVKGSQPGSFVHYPKMTIGKGLYGDGDLFFNFIPFNQVTRFSRYGLQYRQSLFQFKSIPLNISLLAHANSANIEDKLITRTFGADAIASLMVQTFSFAFGFGYAATSGNFSTAIVENDVSTKARLDALHLSASVLHKPGIFVWGLGVDFYKSFIFSLKVGFIF